MRTRSGKDIDIAKPEKVTSDASMIKKPQNSMISNAQLVGIKLNYQKKLKAKDKVILTLTKQLGKAKNGVESFRREIQQLLTCDICEEVFQEPYMLPDCGHTFCLKCLLSWKAGNMPWSGAQASQSLDGAFNFPCPFCRNYEDDRLRKSLVVQSLVDAVAGNAKK